MSTVGIFNSIHHRQVERQKERNREYDKVHKSTTTNQQYNIVDTPDISSLRAAENFIYNVEKYTKLHIKTEYDSIDEYFKQPVDLNSDKTNIMTIFNNGDDYEIKLEKFNEYNSIKVKFIIDVVVNNRSVYTCNTTIIGWSHLSEIMNDLIYTLEKYSQFSTAQELKKCFL